MSENKKPSFWSERHVSLDHEYDTSSYRLPSATRIFFAKAVSILQNDFGFEPAIKLKPDDTTSRGRIKNIFRVNVDWSEWFGLQFHAEHVRSNPVIREIADHFDRLKDAPELREYFDPEKG